MKHRIILDTDIGDDIDDIWALGLLSASNAFSIELLSVCFADIEYKLKTAVCVLNELGASVGGFATGRQIANINTPHLRRLTNVKLPRYKNSVEAMYQYIQNANERVDILAIGPLTNIAELLRKYPDTSSNIRLIIMGGSVFKGYLNSNAPCKEFNFYMDAQSAVEVLSSDAEIVLAPLDACRDFIIQNKNYLELRKNGGRTAKLILDFYDEWQECYHGGAMKFDPAISSGILYDLVPVLYLMDESLFNSERLSIEVLQDGFTRVSEAGREMTVLTSVRDYDRAYETVLKCLLK